MFSRASGSEKASRDPSSEHNYFTHVNGLIKLNGTKNNITLIDEEDTCDEDCVQGAQVLLNFSKRRLSFDDETSDDQRFNNKCPKKV